MNPTEDDAGKPEAPPRLTLLKSETVRRRRGPADASDRGSRLRLIDCRPNLLQIFKRARRRAPLREGGERFLGRFAAFVAAKIRR